VLTISNPNLPSAPPVQTPAGPMRSSVTVKLSLDGTKFSAGPRYYYHEPNIPVWQRTLLSDDREHADATNTYL
jgi:hypothetical protein